MVHGGEAFSASVVLDDDVVERIRACNDLAPLHNPANVLGIEIARREFPRLIQVAVFDTAFHHTLPPKAFTYAVPYELYERHRVRRYGFHGTSHAYVAGEAARRLGRPLEELQLVTAHLGNGCSACAIKNGRSVDTTMGFTPLEGLVMGTRSGDVDPNLHQFLSEQTGRSLAEVTDLLNRAERLARAVGRQQRHAHAAAGARARRRARGPGHRRLLLPAGQGVARPVRGARSDRRAGVHRRYRRARGADPRPDPGRRSRVLAPVLDPARNAAHGAGSGGRITADRSPLTALVIATNEELMIARETARHLEHG